LLAQRKKELTNKNRRMTGVNPHVGFENGTNRAFGPGDQPKMKQANIYVSYRVDTETIRMQRAAYTSGMPMLSHPPAGNDFRLLEGEPAFKIRGKGDEVFTALNGLEAEFMEAYINDPEMARLCVRSVIQFVGMVEQSARTDMQEPRVTLCVAGSVNVVAPGEYNNPGQANSQFVAGNRVNWDVPNLKSPIVGGSGISKNKILGVPIGADATPISSRLVRQLAHIVNDPIKYKSIMSRFDRQSNSMVNAAVAIVNWQKVSALMVINQLVNEGYLSFNTGQNQHPELAGATVAEQIAKLGEGISVGDPHGVMPPNQFTSSLSGELTRKYANTTARLNNVMFPLPDPTTGKYNAYNEFGFDLRGRNGQPHSIGRSTENGEILRTPVGLLLQKSLTATEYAIQSIAILIDDDTRMEAGWAASTPNQHGTAWGQIVLQPHGGMRPHML
jgi:hypothetical protein